MFYFGDAQGLEANAEESIGRRDFKDIDQLSGGDDHVGIGASLPEDGDQFPSGEKGEVHIDEDHGEVIAFDEDHGGFGGGGDGYFPSALPEVNPHELDIHGVVFDDEDGAPVFYPGDIKLAGDPGQGFENGDVGHLMRVVSEVGMS